MWGSFRKENPMDVEVIFFQMALITKVTGKMANIRGCRFIDPIHV
jgi:hypothetical protein